MILINNFGASTPNSILGIQIQRSQLLPSAADRNSQGANNFDGWIKAASTGGRTNG
jgi:hypothetical protein